MTISTRTASALTALGLLLAALAMLLACDPGARAADAGATPAADAAATCVEGTTRCAADALERCTDGRYLTAEVCTAGTFCEAARGCVSCAAGATTACAGATVVVCHADGSLGEELARCDGTQTCHGGACVDACARAAEEKSYAGCEYVAADLDNVIEFYGWPQGAPPATPSCFADATLVTTPLCTDGVAAAGVCGPDGDCQGAAITTCQLATFCAGDAQHAPFAVVVANPDADRPVAVRLADRDGHQADVTLAPGETRALLPQALGFVDRSLDHSGVGSAYHVTAARPIVAYQFNPLDDVQVFSNDASLLLPRHAWGTEHLAVTYRTATRRPERDDWDGTITVVAAGDGETEVTVTPAAPVRAGPGVPALAAGEAHTFRLGHLDALELEGAGGDLTGSRIVSDRPVLVFAGHEATGIGGTCCADHLEDVLLPTHAWGQRYAVARSQRRAGGARDLVRVVALRPGTQVTFEPPVATCTTLAPGLSCDAFIDEDVVISGTGPIMVAHFLGSDGGSGPNSGDPALALAVPVEQFRREYTLLVPDTYFNSYLSLVVPAGGDARVDGVPVTALTPVGQSGLGAARVHLAGGTHHVTCSRGCGVEVYGWGEAVSYLYPGGLDVRRLVE